MPPVHAPKGSWRMFWTEVGLYVAGMVVTAILSGAVTWWLISWWFRREADRYAREVAATLEAENIRLWEEHGFKFGADGKPVYVGKWSKEWLAEVRREAKRRQIGEGLTHGTSTTGDSPGPEPRT
jgi:hypothetical protein